MIIRLVIGIIGGLAVAILGVFLCATAVGYDPASALVRNQRMVLYPLWALSVAVAVAAPSIAKAVRRMLVAVGLMCLSLPLASMALAGGEVLRADTTGAAAGAILGGGLITIASGFLGFFLGAVFLVAGAFVGRDPRIIVLREDQYPPRA